MIEKILWEYLNEALAVPVYLEIPKDRPETYVTIEKTGSSRDNHVNRATFAVQSVATSMYDAMALNEAAKEAMDGAIVLPEIAKAKLNSDYNFTDTTTKEYRYQAVYDIVHY